MKLITDLKGIGPRTTEHLHRLHIHTIQDLLFHLPFRYQDRTRVYPIRSVKPQDQVLIVGEIVSGSVVFGKRRSLLCYLKDSTGIITLRFFHFTRQQQEMLTRSGARLCCFGEVREGYRGYLEIVHPEYKELLPEALVPVENQLTPIYPTTQGMQQPLFRKCIQQALAWIETVDIPEYIPDHLPLSFTKMTLKQALKIVHAPSPDVDLVALTEGQHPAQRRLALEELIAQQLGLQQLRIAMKAKSAPVLVNKKDLQSLALQEKFIQQLPFSLTSAQRRVIHEVNDDIEKATPMLRLVQGDVGSGKTVIAAAALIQAVASGYQTAFMAPTELLAEQHYQTLKSWLAPLGVSLGFLSGSQIRSERQIVQEGLAQGTISIVVGTHALFQEDIQFQQLGLIVIDEQHRFGVHQRLALKEKGIQGKVPHQLIMTATPIPRTLAMVAYADLDISVLDELPPGRQSIVTVAISNRRRQDVVERVKIHCEEHRQAYWVCTLIEESTVLQCQAAEATFADLQKQLPNQRMGLIHGRLTASEKEARMQEFKSGQLDLLVATTVIEVGVDVPNATLIIIENPERLGLAQLHQLRGRVGRGHLQSHCVLLYQEPLSYTAQRRLAILRQTQDGFLIAEEDLKLRGPGELLGIRQAGLWQMRIAHMTRDADLWGIVKEMVEYIVQFVPQAIYPLIQRWLKNTENYLGV